MAWSTKSTSGLGKQPSPQTKPYFVWVWSHASNTWVKTVRPDPPVPQNEIYKRRRCIANCDSGVGSGGEDPVWEEIEDVITVLGGNEEPPSGILIPLAVAAPGGSLGGPPPTFPLAAYFPPVSYDIECDSNPTFILGGQDDGVIYDITIAARGFIRDLEDESIITSFNIEKTVEVQGPVVGWTITQVTNNPLAQDLELTIYYGLSASQPNIFLQTYPYNLSLQSLPDGFNNLTLEGFDYYFDIENLDLVDLRRADGMTNGCEVQIPFRGGQEAVNYDINFLLGYNNGPGFVQTGTAKVLNVPGPISAINVIDPDTYTRYTNSSPLTAQGIDLKNWLVRIIGENVATGKVVEFFNHNGPASEMIVLSSLERSDSLPDGLGDPPFAADDGVPFAGGQSSNTDYHVFGSYVSKNDGLDATCDTVHFWRTKTSVDRRVLGGSVVVSIGPGNPAIFAVATTQIPITHITQAQFDNRDLTDYPSAPDIVVRELNDSCLATGNDGPAYGDNFVIIDAVPETGNATFTFPFSGICDYIEPPETCIVTVRDQSGVIFEQTYLGDPQVQISPTITPRPF